MQGGKEMSIAIEKHYTIAEIAQLWGLSWSSVRRILENETGIVIWGHPGNNKRKRYQTIRVPASVLTRIHSRVLKRQ